MIKLLLADFYRMYSQKLLWTTVISMVIIAFSLCVMQHTAMDYSVSLDRVIFLPMTFYGIAMAALVGIFIGDDFNDGTIRNKIISSKTRAAVYFSDLLTCQTAGITVYLLTTLFTLCISINQFEINMTTAEIMSFMALGIFTCLSYCGIYCILSMLVGNKTHAITICMALSFFFLFLSLQTNSVLVQKEYVDGVLNPHYVYGIKRLVYILLQDINPTGQVAQLSSMTCLNPIRFIIVDVVLIIFTVAFGVLGFNKKDIK